MDKKQIGRKFLDIYGKVGVYFLLFIVILIFSLLSDVFLSINNIKNIGKIAVCLTK